jgi:cystathionine beta-lyase/cystathionine gamma-synthase
MNGNFEQSITDFQEDIQWLSYLLEDRKKLLTRKHPSMDNKIVSHMLLSELNSIQTRINETNTDIDQCHNMEQLANISKDIYKHFLSIRSIYNQVSAYTLSTDWQSPSFDGSILNEAGSQEGKIKQSINDYKRDQHEDQRLYEHAFKNEYINHSIINIIHVYATNTGMSALTTIIGFLFGEHSMQHKNILVGAHSYFENKILLRNMFADHYTEYDETNTKQFISYIERSKPQAIFLDSLCNDSQITTPHIQDIIHHIKTMDNYHPFIIIDNTCSSIKFQTLKNLFPLIKNIVVWESLLKYHQFGMDRATGGIIYASCQKGIEFYTYRDHLGTNSTDQQILSMPLPNRNILEQRLNRHARNNLLLSQYMQSWINHNKHTSIEDVISAALVDNTHTSLVYPGSFLTFSFKKKYQHLSYYNQILKKTITLARQENIPLIAGTSFGLPITRIYIPATRNGQGTPFLRLSLGTEHHVQIDRLYNIIRKSIESTI